MIQRIAKSVQPRAIGVSSKTGKPIWAISGAAEGDDGDNPPDPDASGVGGKEGEKPDGSTDSASSDSKPADKDDKVPKAELESALARMKAADKRAADAEKKAKEYEDKDKSELEKANGQLETLTKANEVLTETVQTLRLENAFALSDSGVVWNDPALVMDLVRKRTDVKIDEDGNVAGMDAAIKAIAKDKPYLVKVGADGQPPKSGSNAGSNGNNSAKPDEATLRAKFRI